MSSSGHHQPRQPQGPDLLAQLAPFPRTPLGHWPTPLERAPRLARALSVLGPGSAGTGAGTGTGTGEVFVKRDDINGFAGGGNKLRKLEFLLGRALADGADTVITSGAVQTNHGRQTAAACARLGLRCELILTRTVPRTQHAFLTSGNVALDRLFGARLHLCNDAGEGERTTHALLRAAEDEGRSAVLLPVGGSNALGALGYVAGAAELFGQLRESDVHTAHVIAPLGSAGTAAGLVLGAQLCGWPGTFEFPSVLKPADEARATLLALAEAAAELLGTAAPTLDNVTVHDRTLGPGYGLPTPEMWHALQLFGTQEGIALDPVYTGKAAAALLADTGERALDGPLVFLHTGGLPGLFGYADELNASL